LASSWWCTTTTTTTTQVKTLGDAEYTVCYYTTGDWLENTGRCQIANRYQSSLAAASFPHMVGGLLTPSQFLRRINAGTALRRWPACRCSGA
jgi:hypothetical protein